MDGDYTGRGGRTLRPARGGGRVLARGRERGPCPLVRSGSPRRAAHLVAPARGPSRRPARNTGAPQPVRCNHPNMPIHYEKSGHIVTITIDRPEHRNSLDIDHFGQLADSWVRFRDDDEAYVAILTGVG